MPASAGFRAAFTFVLLAAHLTLSHPAAAQCREPIPPIFPAFDARDLSVMDVAEQKMQRFVNQTEEYLDCMAPEQRKQKMDAVLAEMKRVTADYNALVVAYRKSKAEQLFSETSK